MPGNILGTFADGGAGDLLGSPEGIGGHIALANDDNIFEVSETQALASSLLGLTVQIQRDTAGADANIWESDQAGATKSALIIAIPNRPNQALADTFARVWIQFLGTASAWY